jgi:hypothetical protein
MELTMDAELKAYLEGMESRLGQQIEEARQHTEETETRLLREFWKWARTADARYRQYYGHVTGVDQRVGVVEERVTIIEDRVSEIERGNGSARRDGEE